MWLCYLQDHKSLKHIRPHAHFHIEIGQAFLSLGARQSDLFTWRHILGEVQHMTWSWNRERKSEYDSRWKKLHINTIWKLVYHSPLTGIICFCICNDLQSILEAHLPDVHGAHGVKGLLDPLDQLLSPMSDLFWAQVPSQAVVLVNCAGAAVGGYDWSILKCHLELWARYNDSALY